MKKLISMLLGVALVTFQIAAQSRSVTFKFDPSSTSSLSATTVQAMERNISSLLTSINQAFLDKSALSFEKVSIELQARKNLESLWTNMRFYCENNKYASKCLNDWQGIQVREIDIKLKGRNDYTGDLDRELTVSLSKGGTITGVRMALDNNEYKKFKDSCSVVTDVRIRNELLKFVEDFRCYYNEKNIEALRAVYADDALIITGSVMTKQKTGFDPSVSVKYRKENKEQYLTRLERMFKNKRFIDVQFDRISIKRNGAKPDFFGVTLHQDWKTTGYEDHGWLFLLWDFRDKEHPVIHVRTWQPDQQVDAVGVFDMDDFFF